MLKLKFRLHSCSAEGIRSKERCADPQNLISICVVRAMDRSASLEKQGASRTCFDTPVRFL